MIGRCWRWTGLWVALALASIPTGFSARADAPSPQAELSLPPWPVWTLPTDQQVNGRRAEVTRQAGLCARAPSTVCALRLAELRGTLAVDHADRGEPEAAALVLEQVITSKPAQPAEIAGWLDLVERLADQVHHFGSLGLERALRLAAVDGWAQMAGRGSIEHVQALLRLGQVERDMDLSVSASQRAASALAVAAPGVLGPEPNPETATAHLLMAEEVRRGGDFVGARAHLEEGLRQRIALYGEESLPAAEAKRMLGTYLGNMRDRVAGERLLTEVIGTLERLNADPEQVAVAHLWIGLLYGASAFSEREYTETQEGLMLLNASGSRNRDYFSAGWNNLATLFGQHGRYDLARELLQRSIDERTRAGLADSITFATNCSNLGNVCLLLGKVPESIRWNTQAVEIVRRQMGQASWKTGTMIRGLAAAQAQAGLTDAARASMWEVLKNHTAHAATVFDEFSERVGLNRIQQSKWTLYQALSILERPEDTTALWDAVLTWKGAVQEAATRRHLVALSDGTQADVLTQLLAIRGALANQALSEQPGGGGTGLEVNALLEQKDLLERELIGISKAAAAPFVPARLDELCARLPASSALVEYVTYKRHSFVPDTALALPTYYYLTFVLRPDACEQPTRIELGPAKSINSLSQRWRAELEALSRGTGLVSQADREGRALRVRIWDPLREALGDADRIYLVPDGELEQVPIAALPISDGRYLLEQWGVSTLDHARDLARWAFAPPVTGSSALLVGDLAYDPLSPRRGGRATPAAVRQVPPCGARVEPLPGTRTELRQVARRLRAVGVHVGTLEGADGGEAALNRLAPGAQILHLATHGYVLDPTCAPAARDTPSALAGLAVAGANEPLTGAPGAPDGLWSAEEISGLDLRQTALVVLSACGSGLGKPNDMDGLQSVRRAFAVAGAREMVYTVGPVSDQATTALMNRFYRHLGRGAVPAEALLIAQRETLASQRGGGRVDPSAWAAFVVMGRWTQNAAAPELPSASNLHFPHQPWW